MRQEIADEYDNNAHAALVGAKFVHFDEQEVELKGLRKDSNQMEEL
jgi:hypothetical protein